MLLLVVLVLVLLVVVVCCAQLRCVALGVISCLVRMFLAVFREIIRLKEGFASKTSQRDELNAALRVKHEELNGLSTAIRIESSQISRVRTEINELSSGAQSKARLLHPSLPALLDRIRQVRQVRQFRAPVLGPIGLCVKIQAGQERWSTALERILGPRMRAFIVSNQSDHNVLCELMKELRCEKHFSIIVQSPGERYRTAAIPNALTVADVLTYETSGDAAQADVVFNALVDQVGIERIALVNDEDALDRGYVVRDEHGFDTLRDGISRCVTADGTTVFFKNGNRMPENMRGNTRNILASDFSATVARMQEEVQLKSREVQRKEQQKAELTREIAARNDEVRRFDGESRSHEQQVRALERQLESLREQLLEVRAVGSIDTSHLEEELRELEAVVVALDNSADQVQQQITAMKADLVIKKQEKEAMEQRMQELGDELEQQVLEINELNNEQRELKRKAVQMQKIVDKCQQDVNATQRDIRRCEVDYSSSLEKARLVMQKTSPHWDGSPVEVSPQDTVQGLNRTREKLQLQLERSKEEFNVRGFSKETLMRRVAVAERAYNDEKLKLDDLSGKVTELKEDLELRKAKYDKALKRSFKAVKHYFDSYLKSQSFTGEIIYDHEEKTLDLVVQTDEANADTKNKFVGNLSGGERSLVTFCFLLALGHVVSCQNKRKHE